MNIVCNFDDFNPSQDYDFGRLFGRTYTYLLRLNQLGMKKCTLFTVPNWQDFPHSLPHRIMRKTLGMKFYYGDERNRIDKFPQWCNAVRENVNKGIWEIAIHGYTHFNEKTGLHQQEFLNLTHREAVERLEMAMNLFDDAKIPFVKIFRPAGYGFNQATLSALESCGFIGIAPFPSWYRNTKFKMGNLKVVPSGGMNIHIKRHLCRYYGSEMIDGGIEDDVIYQKLVNKITAFPKDITYKFVSEVL